MWDAKWEFTKTLKKIIASSINLDVLFFFLIFLFAVPQTINGDVLIKKSLNFVSVNVYPNSQVCEYYIIFFKKK